MKNEKRTTFFLPKIKNVIFNDPATIVLWEDNTKTVVKVQGEDVFDPEKGLAMAIVKRALGNKGRYCEIFKQWLPKEEEKPVYSPISELDQKMKEASERLLKMCDELSKKNEH